MLATYSVNDALDAATVLAEKLPAGLTRRVYRALLIPAIENAKLRGYVNASRVTYHCPAEVIAAALGISRMSLWRAVQVLKDAGLVDNRAQKATLDCRGGQVRNTGSVWCVRLTVGHGSRAKLSYDDLRHKWRPGFNDEVRRGRGSYQAVRAAKLRTRENPQELDLELLLRFAVDKTFQVAPVNTSLVRNTPKNAVLEVLLDVPFAAPGRDTVQRVNLAASALAVSLSDASSLDFYRRLVWGALRANQGQLDYFQVIYTQAVRIVRGDIAEGFARRPGALLVSRLRQAGILEELMQT